MAKTSATRGWVGWAEVHSQPGTEMEATPRGLEERAGIRVVKKLQQLVDTLSKELLSGAEEVAAGSGSSQLP